MLSLLLVFAALLTLVPFTVGTLATRANAVSNRNAKNDSMILLDDSYNSYNKTNVRKYDQGMAAANGYIYAAMEYKYASNKSYCTTRIVRTSINNTTEKKEYFSTTLGHANDICAVHSGTNTYLFVVTTSNNKVVLLTIPDAQNTAGKLTGVKETVLNFSIEKIGDEQKVKATNSISGLAIWKGVVGNTFTMLIKSRWSDGNFNGSPFRFFKKEISLNVSGTVSVTKNDNLFNMGYAPMKTLIAKSSLNNTLGTAYTMTATQGMCYDAESGILWLPITMVKDNSIEYGAMLKYTVNDATKGNITPDASSIVYSNSKFELEGVDVYKGRVFYSAATYYQDPNRCVIAEYGHTHTNNSCADKTCGWCRATVKATKAHTWVQTKVSKNATCFAKGAHLYTCSACKATKTVTDIAATGGTKKISAIAATAKSYADYVDKNKKLPASGTYVTNEEFVYLAAKAIVAIKGGKASSTSVSVSKAISKAPSPSESMKKTTNFTKAKYAELCTGLVNYVNKNGRIPNYVTGNSVTVRYENLLYHFACILRTYYNSGKYGKGLPASMNFRTWAAIIK